MHIMFILRYTIHMKKIKLTKGLEAIVDDDMFEELNQWKWYARKGRYTWYATRKVMEKLPNGRWRHKKLVHMHREVKRCLTSIHKPTIAELLMRCRFLSANRINAFGLL